MMITNQRLQLAIRSSTFRLHTPLSVHTHLKYVGQSSLFGTFYKTWLSKLLIIIRFVDSYHTFVYNINWSLIRLINVKVNYFFLANSFQSVSVQSILASQILFCIKQRTTMLLVGFDWHSVRVIRGLSGLQAFQFCKQWRSCRCLAEKGNVGGRWQHQMIVQPAWPVRPIWIFCGNTNPAPPAPCWRLLRA